MARKGALTSSHSNHTSANRHPPLHGWLAATMVRRNVAKTKVSSSPVGSVGNVILHQPVPGAGSRGRSSCLSWWSATLVSAQKGGCAPSADARMGLPGAKSLLVARTIVWPVAGNELGWGIRFLGGTANRRPWLAEGWVGG